MLVGSETVTRRVAPARTAFSTISYEQRAVERMKPAAGSRPAAAKERKIGEFEAMLREGRDDLSARRQEDVSGGSGNRYR